MTEYQKQTLFELGVGILVLVGYYWQGLGGALTVILIVFLAGASLALTNNTDDK